MRVSCTTSSIFYAHNIWQLTLHTMIYGSIMHHILQFLHTQHMASDAPHHALSQTAPLHLTAYGSLCSASCSMRLSCTIPSIFYTYDIWQVTLHTMLYYTLHSSIFHTHSIWQVTLHTMLYESITHYTLHFLHTQHMAGDAPHHALLHTAPLRFPYTQHMAGDAPHHALSHTALPPSFIHIAYDRRVWCMILS